MKSLKYQQPDTSGSESRAPQPVGGGRPSISSTSGTAIWWNSRRAYGDTDSR